MRFDQLLTNVPNHLNIMTTSNDFNFETADLNEIHTYLEEQPETELGFQLMQAYYCLGKWFVVWNIMTKEEAYKELDSHLQRYTFCRSSDPDSDYKTYLKKASEELDKGIEAGLKILPLEDKELPLNPLIAADFPRTKNRKRSEPNTGLRQVFMERLVADKVRFNIRTKNIIKDGQTLTVPETDEIDFRKEHGWAPKEKFDKLLYGYARKNEFDPVREYLDTLEPFDIEGNQEDLACFEYMEENLLSILFGMTNDHPHYLIYSAFIKMWLVAAVMRVYRPGSKFDSTLVLIGDKGLRKSSFFAALGDGNLDLGGYDPEAEDIQKWAYSVGCKAIGNGSNKDALMICHRYWLVVLDEVDGLSSKESSEIKNFIQQSFDAFRVPYGRVTEEFDRRFVFGATTNFSEFLSDPDPDRRWLPIVIDQMIPTESILEYRDRIWKWAKTAYFNGLRKPYMSELETEAHGRLYSAHTIEGEHDSDIDKLISTLLNTKEYAGNNTPDSPALVFQISTLYELFEAHGRYPKKTLREALVRAGFVLQVALKRDNFNYGKVCWHRDQKIDYVQVFEKPADVLKQACGINT